MQRRRALAIGGAGLVGLGALVAVLVALGVGGVGANSGGTAAVGPEPAGTAGYGHAAPPSAGAADRDDPGAADSSTGRAGSGAAELVAPGAADQASQGAVGPGADARPRPDAPTSPELAGRAVVRQASVRMEVADPVAAVGDVRSAVTAAGGFVADERSAGRGAALTLRVPVAGLDALVDRIGGLGTVTERTATARDVTDQLVDTDARVASQRASVERVRALLARAESIGEIVAVESELSARQADLDSLERRLAALRASTELATVDVTLTPPAAVPPPAAGAGFGSGLGAGWAQLRAIGAGLAAAGGFVLPFLPVVAVLVLVGRLLVRRLRARRAPAAVADPG